MKRIHEIRKTDLFSHWINIGYLPRWGVLLLDLLIVLIAFVVSYFIGNSVVAGGYNLSKCIPIWEQMAFVLLTQCAFFWVFHTYSGILRYSTFVDTVKVALSVGASGGLLVVINLIIKYATDLNAPFLTSILLIYIFVGITLLFGWRVTIKTIFEYISHHNSSVQKVLIYGTKSAGLSIAKMLQSNMESLYRPAGFISDSNDNTHHKLLGLKVYPLNTELIALMKNQNIGSIIISPLKMKELNPLEDLSLFMENNIRILTTPYFTNYSPNQNEDNTHKIGRIESIQVEDLLERPAIDINTNNVKSILKNKVVLVSGGAGSIGSEIVRQIATFKPKAIILMEIAESPLHDLTVDLRQQYPYLQFIPIIADVRDVQMVEKVFEEYHPNVVFHAAAYKHVPLMEDFPTQAIMANVLGTKNMADMAVKYHAERFVMISTDKAVNPTNVMGASKRIAEIYVQSLFLKQVQQDTNCTKFITTRFGNVLGSNGSVVPFFKKQIAKGGPVTVTHPDIIRYFMTIPEASCLVLEAATLGNGGEIFCFDMGHPVRIADLAKNMIRLAGFVPGKDIEIIYTGLRPGEKLYEELLNQKETTLPTSNKKILVAKVREYDFDVVAQQIDEIIREARIGRVFPVVQKMKDIVPEFKSKNSVYEQLDK
jgi:FlaA1/EpsC-like NDP-sugar epimerase